MSKKLGIEIIMIPNNTAKIISHLCEKNEIYFGIFNNLKDIIERGIDAVTIEQIAKNIFDDIMKTKNEALGIYNNFSDFDNIAA